jgi:CBS-domain-containing membrane protein
MTTKVKDVMTPMVVVANEDSSFKGIVGLMHEYGVSALPVVDDEGRLTGIVSEADMILKEDPELEGEHASAFDGRHRRRERAKAGGRVARELMTTTVVSGSRGRDR